MSGGARKASPFVFLPAALLAAAAVLTYLFASEAFRFIGLVLGAFAVLAAVWGLSCCCPPRARRALRAAVAAAILLACMAFGVLEGLVLSGDRSEIKGSPKIMVILGAQVKPWGPSVLLQDRLDTALDYLEDHPEMTVVVSGGQGRDEHISEARCMYDYLTAHGVDGGRILMEEQSHNTWENLNNTFALLKQGEHRDEMGQVLVVSNGFHLARVRMLFGRVWEGTYQLSTLAAPSSHLPSRVNSYVREAPALLKSWLLDR